MLVGTVAETQQRLKSRGKDRLGTVVVLPSQHDTIAMRDHAEKERNRDLNQCTFSSRLHFLGEYARPLPCNTTSWLSRDQRG